MKYFVDRAGILDGTPEKIRSKARQLTTVASSIDRVAGMLQKVSTHGAWESPAGDAFASQVGSTPSELFDVANRLRKSAQIIRPYADLLEASQEAITDCDTTAHTARQTMKDKDEELEGMADDDPDRARVQRERGEAAADLNRAERRFERESTDAQGDESRMAGRLHDVCEEMTDPFFYDVLEMMTTTGESASEAGIIAKPLALAGVAKPIGLAGRRAFYDEGSYGDVAKASGRYAVDTVSFGAGRVVGRAKNRFFDKEVSRIPALESKPVRIKDNPITKSSRAGTSTRAASERFPAKRYDPLPSRVPASVRDVARRKTGMDDIKQAFDDWEIVAGEGRVARVAVAVQNTAKQGNRVRSAAAQTTLAGDEAGVTQDAKEERARRERQGRTAERMTDEPSVDDLVTTPIEPPAK